MSGIDPRDSRQGTRGTPILKILVAGLILCVIAFIGLGFYGWAMPDQTLTNATATATPPAASPATTATGAGTPPPGEKVN